jgi:hypothetical protein
MRTAGCSAVGASEADELVGGDSPSTSERAATLGLGAAWRSVVRRTSSAMWAAEPSASVLDPGGAAAASRWGSSKESMCLP